MSVESQPPRDGVYRIWVPGEPESYPKKDVSVIGFGKKCPVCKKPFKQRLIPTDKDYQTRKDPEGRIDPKTGKIRIVKYNHGYKRAWMKKIRDAVSSYMARHMLDPFPKGDPIALGCLFYVPQAPSNRTDWPAQKPDLDNLKYSVWNALGFDKDRPEGVLYYDDGQIVWTLGPDGMLWASDLQPPGVLITVCSAYLLADKLHHYQQATAVRLKV